MSWQSEDDIARLELDLMERLGDAGITVAAPADVVHRDPDVLFTYPSVTPGELTVLLRGMAPRLVFVTSSSFDPADVDSDDAELRLAARQHAGDLFRLSVLWAADGVLFAWSAVADWHDKLLDEVELSDYQARGIDQVERELRIERSAAATQRLTEIVTESADFRGATTNRRTAQVKIIMDAHPDLVADLWFPNDFARRARAAAAVEVARYEAELDANEDILDQIILELAGGRPVNQQRMRVAEILRACADGWALSEGFVEKIRLKALDRMSRR
ncbi:hypothetical protein ACH3VR_22960 [Microbacterium sp. B2969]|uniref:Uncharacterized protein n=1 Tax=Microbacterium alkaliflavum TaxID=3248839 RepID=A0ABW7QER2_9MICO